MVWETVTGVRKKKKNYDDKVLQEVKTKNFVTPQEKKENLYRQVMDIAVVMRPFLSSGGGEEERVDRD